MNDETKGLLEETIKEEINNLTTLKTGSEEKSTAIEDIAKLYKLKIDESKVVNDAQEKEIQRKTDTSLKEQQLTEQTKERYFRFGAEAAGIILPLIFYATWMRKGFKFEESGTFTSTTFRGLFQKFKPTKK
ncbi:MAG: hypothetical protein PHS74_00565 [Lachnospiraceae bacterium]|nr:hypothetical protein [Lachnospiraceae bacterium]